MCKTLRNPVLDIHSDARLDSKNFASKDKLPYALVISVDAMHLGELYDRIIHEYAGAVRGAVAGHRIPVKLRFFARASNGRLSVSGPPAI